jgi:putative transcriptional regulator
MQSKRNTSAAILNQDKIAYEKLKLERARQGKGIGEVAELAGLDPKTISRIEKGRVIPRPQTIGKIAKALGKNYEDFLYPVYTIPDKKEDVGNQDTSRKG